ncbi:hypothetical protein GGR54DRAFT_24643 [Hypoxylon sp. NC1633]|nr:hypothetical protein GGR54DRAFT_24643 [Hypoxylon sp. NC1633]
MSTRRRLRELVDATREQLSTMSGRYHVSPTDFDLLYQLYQEDTSAKGLYAFIVDHPITLGIAKRLGIKPIEALATMVGKTGEACQQELNTEIEIHQAAEKKVAEARKKARARAESEKETGYATSKEVQGARSTGSSTGTGYLEGCYDTGEPGAGSRRMENGV